MFTISHIKEIYNKLIQDETFCRLLVYGENPLDENLPDIVGSTNHEQTMLNYIFFAPQISSIEKEERVRISMYKSVTKIGTSYDSVRQDFIEFDIYVPYRLVNLDLRMYLIENKIATILDGYNISGIGHLDYVNGTFVQLPPISGYAEFRMLFLKQEGRSMYGKF